LPFSTLRTVTSPPAILAESFLKRHLQSLIYPHQGSQGGCDAHGFRRVVLAPNHQ
jgi:hypothetical protein